jgi:glycosyltransferase involved in cell wall biosynthesis
MDRLMPPPEQATIQSLWASIVAPAVIGDLNAIELLDKCRLLGDGEFVCLLAAANGHLHVLEFLRDSGYDVPAMLPKILPLAEANERHAVVRFLREMQANPEAKRRKTHRDLSAYPTVSVLLANYNHARYLHTSLSGIFGQRHPANEVIVVDDGSSDESVAILESYARQQPTLRLFVNDTNRGQHYSIQRALAAASGDYVVWASSDDLLLPRFLERSLDVLKQHPKAGVCFSRLAVFVDGTTEHRVYDATHAAPFNYGKEPSFLSPARLVEILRKHYLWMSGNTVLARRDALEEIGGFEGELRWHADWFAYYVIALRHGACMIPETLAMMRERTGTYSATGVQNRNTQRRVLTALMDAIKSDKYKDLLPVFRRCPSLFSPFGMNMARATVSAPRHYDFLAPMTQRYVSQFVRRKLSPVKRAWQRARQGKAKTP